MFRKSVAELVETVREVCPLPSSTAQLLVLLGDPEVRLDRVAELIATDPALAAEVMRIANGPLFAVNRKINDLGQAILVIGLSELRNMAMAMSMLATFRTGKELAFDFHDTAVLSGSVARSLAPDLRLGKSEAFLCGLLCEIGAMACTAVDSKGYAALWEQLTETHGGRLQREALETERYGATSKTVGAKLLERNGLPVDIAQAIGDSLSERSNPLGRLTHFAREAAPCIVHAGKQKTGEADLHEALTALSHEARLDLDTSTLPQRCVTAAGLALSAIRRANR